MTKSKTIQDQAEGMLSTFWPNEWKLTPDQREHVARLMAAFAYAQTSKALVELVREHNNGRLKP